jgi:transcription initiation factor TFIIIB Brf1 subunit/transcription initiation factor TFIIB
VDSGTMIAPRIYLTVKDVMILMGCKEDKAYKTMRKINDQSEKEGYMRFDAGKVNKYVFAEKLNIPEEEIERVIQFVSESKQQITVCG